MSYKSSSISRVSPPRLAAQEQLVPGSSLEAKFERLRELGYQGIEVRSRGEFHFKERQRELTEAVRNGVTISSACVDMPYFIGDLDPGRRRDAIENLKSQFGVLGAVGGAGVVAPASYGILSRRLPPYTSPRSTEGDREVMIESLSVLGRAAENEGVILFLEPLNRYEDFILNTINDGVDLIRDSGDTGVALCDDFYHMNIEEADIAESLLYAGKYVGHIHVSDSNRHEPGTGHIDWLSGVAALVALDYEGWMVLECRPQGTLDECLVRSRQTIVDSYAAVVPVIANERDSTSSNP